MEKFCRISLAIDKSFADVKLDTSFRQAAATNKAGPFSSVLLFCLFVCFGVMFLCTHWCSLSFWPCPGGCESDPHSALCGLYEVGGASAARNKHHRRPCGEALVPESCSLGACVDSSAFGGERCSWIPQSSQQEGLKFALFVMVVC